MNKGNIIRTVICMALTAILVFYLMNRCGCGNSEKPQKDTIVKHDTLYKGYLIDTQYVPKPIKVPFPVHDTVPFPVHDTVPILAKVDTAAILKDYYAVKFYEDTQKIQYGRVIISDALRQNRVMQRKLKVEQKIPEITKTELVAVELKNQVFAGVGVLSNGKMLLPGVTATLKNRRDNMLDAGVYYQRGNVWWFSAGVKTKIRLK